MAKSEEPSDKQMWVRWGKLTFYGLILAGIGFLVGLYIIAPMQAKTSGYVPETVTKMRTVIVRFTNPDEGEVLLPLKMADEREEREQGLNNVGKDALANTYLLYDQGDVSTWGEDYDVSNIKAPLSLAVINGEGEVIAIKEATLDDDEVEVDEDHRWVLALEKNLLDKYGLEVGSQLVTKTLQVPQPVN